MWFGFFIYISHLGKNHSPCLHFLSISCLHSFYPPFIRLHERKWIRWNPIIWHSHTQTTLENTNALVSMKLFPIFVHCQIQCAFIIALSMQCNEMSSTIQFESRSKWLYVHTYLWMSKRNCIIDLILKDFQALIRRMHLINHEIS